MEHTTPGYFLTISTSNGYSMVRNLVQGIVRELYTPPPPPPSLSSGDIATFSHREFSFTLAGDIYVRYKSFDSQEDFERELKKLSPEKIDIGAVFSDKVVLLQGFALAMCGSVGGRGGGGGGQGLPRLAYVGPVRSDSSL